MSDEEYEVVNVSGSPDNWLRNVVGDISRESAMKQVGVGAVSGMLAGFLFVKVGKVAAATMGTTVLLIQGTENWEKSRHKADLNRNTFLHQFLPEDRSLIAQHQGYIQINWDRVRQSTRQAEREARRAASTYFPGLFQNGQSQESLQNLGGLLQPQEPTFQDIFRSFMQENLFLAVGFGGGFLVGMAF